MPLVLAEFDLRDRTQEINVKAVQIARQAADEFSTPEKPRFVAGSIGPTTKNVSVTGTATFEQMRESYMEQARALMEGGADLLLVETAFDTGSLKAALLAIDQLRDELGRHIPVIASVTIEQNGTMLAGQGIDALYTSIANHDLLAVGMNCATGPDMMTDHIRTLDQMSTHRISCYPNAGLPNSETGKFGETPESLAGQLEKFAERGWLNIVGGCCGTTPAHIRAIAEVVSKYKPRPLKSSPHRAYYSGKELVEADESNRPLIVGERTNVIGSRLFKDMVAAEKWEEATDIGRRQVRNGAHIVDVCLQSSDRDEIKDIPLFYEKLMRKIKAPVMIDTTDPKAVELALTYCQGKSIINSINLEDGEEKFEKMCPIAHEYGAALIIGTIDEDKLQAQAFTRERKLAVAKRSVELATAKYKIAVEDLIIDPLVFPCATGDENYIGGAVETIEALRLIKAEIPFVKTVLGVSNISFGLPASAREVVNSVFLYHCTKAGLDLAIVNSEKLERFGSIPVEERHLAENLLFNTPPPGRDEFKGTSEDWRQQTREQKAAINQFHIAAIAEHFRGASKKEKTKAADMPLDQRLGNYIIEGTKDGLIPDLDLKLKEGTSPLDVVNGPLMAGMSEVGRLFNNNELIVAEVLQSAEAMKAAVNHLEKFMEKADTAARGKVVLATVKGDVHDIGKNLVEIILSNNGYTVVNLGIKVPPEELIKAYREHKPDAIGLSGLLVKSAHMMVTTAGDLREAGIDVPLLVGGAALSEKFTTGKIGPAYLAPTLYAKDAMTGLRLMNELMDPASADSTRVKFTFTEVKAGFDGPQVDVVPLTDVRSSKVRTDIPVPSPGYLDRRVRVVPDLDEVWSYINPYMLYGRHMGFKGNFEKLVAERDPKALSLFHDMEEVRNAAREFMKIRAVWRFLEAERDGNSIHLFEPEGATPVHTFHYGRQAKGDGLCLSDFVLEPVTGRDHVAIFVVTAGEGVRARSEEAKAKGEFFQAHGLQALAIETAEGCA
jgi:5-methyltetrahydrofolate--homocysteine methyltransferase